MADTATFNWIVLVGGFTGDGSAEHKLFRLDTGDPRIPFFNSHAAAEEYVLTQKLGEYAVIAEVTVTAKRATELNYRSGRRIVATEI